MGDLFTDLCLHTQLSKNKNYRKWGGIMEKGAYNQRLILYKAIARN